MRTCLGNIPLLPLSSTVLELHQSVGVVHPTQHMVLVLPNRAPHRDVVKATIENPGNVLALSQWLDGLAHGRERQLHFGRFTDKAGFLVTSESMIEDAAPPRRDAQHIEGPIAWHQMAHEAHALASTQASPGRRVCADRSHRRSARVRLRVPAPAVPRPPRATAPSDAPHPSE